MFQIFPQLPSDLRRKIWLATLGPMTLTFTTEHPSVALDRRRVEQGTAEDGMSPQSINHYTLPVPYFGHVELEDGSSRLYFAVESTAAYQACRESRAFLHFFFAENTKPEGGLPSWFCSEIDIVKLNIRYIHDAIKYSWFLRTQHLVLTLWDPEHYLGVYDDVIGHEWVEENLHSLKDLTVRMNEGCTFSKDGPVGIYHWLTDWFQSFESFYNPEDEQQPPLRFYLRIISYTAPEEEWLSPTNYLRVEKLVHQKMLHFGQNTRRGDPDGRKAALVAATDDELDNPAEYLAKRRLAQRQFWERKAAANPRQYGLRVLEDV